MSITEVEAKALSFPDKARQLKIADSASFTAAGEFLKSIKALRYEIAETFGPIREKAHSAWKETIRQQERVEAPLIEAEAILKPAISCYLQEQERLRRLEELRLEKEARDEAERQQVENAALLDDIGETAAANTLLDEPPIVVPVFVPRTAPKVSGVVMSARYSAEVTSLMELVKAVASGRAPIQCLQADTVFLNRQAIAMKDALNYPGVRLKKDNNISAGRK